MKSTCTYLLISLLSLLPTTSMVAQQDVTELFLNNWGFDSYLDYTASDRGNVAQEILPVEGWTKSHSVDYTIVGSYAFGTAKTFNTNGRIPATGHDNSAGGLALSTGWDQSLIYTQEVTLPLGTYTIKSAWWNGSNATAGYSLVGWLPNSGTAQMSTLAAFTRNAWTTDEVSFTLTRQTAGKLQLGLKAAAGPSTNSAKVVLDYVKLFLDDTNALKLIRTRLRSLITTATRQYGNGSGINAEQLKAQIDAAQAAYDDTDSPYSLLISHYRALTTAADDYANTNASEDNPRDITALYLTNPDFEQGTTAWTVSNLQTQTNSYFTRKHGTTYLETWKSIGNNIDDASVSQVVKRLPRGKYRLKASGLHIQQSGANSTVNSGKAQTGATLYAGSFETPITANAVYSLDFSVLDEQADVTVGARVEGGTGNWFCIDNFLLYYTGAIDAAAIAANLQTLVAEAEAYLADGVQDNVRSQVEPALATAHAALSASPLDEAALNASISELTPLITAAEESNQRYLALRELLVYARKVLGWWADVPRKATAWANLNAAIATAEAKAVDYSLTNTQLTAARTTLNTRVASVDKRIYYSANAVGTSTDLQNASNNWATERSLQSKHWVLYWDKGYENTRPAGIDDILATADRIFEFYADSLKFININTGTSKTDTYKMIIRLRSTTEWEASGSGIDDQIGLLTLSRWAYTSRDGQTMAHEIGHCFQYQTHCDNNNQNGFMYANGWGSVFWEMCAQWQAYKYYPSMQFGNEWFWNTLNWLHREPFDPDLRYNSFFLQDYWCQHHADMGIVATIWNKSVSPEDPFQAYMRLTMTGTTAQKAAQLADEMWEYGARMATFDIDGLRSRGASWISTRAQCQMHRWEDVYWMPDSSNCIENYGNNAIRLKVPSTTKATEIAVHFRGMAGAQGYRAYNVASAGWRYGFVALLRDGTRVYSDMQTATASDPDGLLWFTVPAGCTDLFCIVSGGPTRYWTRPWTDDVTVKEQWPYAVGFYQTNLIGYANTIPTAVTDVLGDVATTPTSPSKGIFTLQGHRLTTSPRSLPRGIYLVDGRKVVVR